MQNLVQLLKDSMNDAEDALTQMRQTGNVEATKVVFTHLKRSCDELRSIGHHQTADSFMIKGIALIESQEAIERDMLMLEQVRQQGGIDAAITYVSARLSFALHGKKCSCCGKSHKNDSDLCASCQRET